jgi:streptogrisin C
MRFTRTVGSSILTLALALSAAPALAADSHDGTGQRPGQAGAGSLSRDISAAVQRDLGFSPAQVRKQGGQQERAIKLDQRLQDSLGEAFAGSVYNERTGKLVVMVSDAEQLDEATAAGADARLVT